ncbi:MAG: NUDIX domain-containing protein [Solirubrobacteraceae bacterium]|nr:NUDIX domain-containing protein [Solirubrobacteraceae bacterium]
MAVSESEPGQELAGDNVAPARQAASIVLLRGGDDTLELLLVQRTPKARFMGGVWVFPGGAVDAHEGEGDASHRIAAVRELEEEAAVGGIAPEALVKYSQWITPEQVAIRFDTHFFLAETPDGAEPKIDGEECVDLGWFTPADALRAGESGEIALVFPTIKHLEQFATFPTAAALLAHARAHDVVPVLPKVVMSGETARVLLPGEPGYDEH